jgi:hypothetical protein
MGPREKWEVDSHCLRSVLHLV